MSLGSLGGATVNPGCPGWGPGTFVCDLITIGVLVIHLASSHASGSSEALRLEIASEWFLITDTAKTYVGEDADKLHLADPATARTARLRRRNNDIGSASKVVARSPTLAWRLHPAPPSGTASDTFAFRWIIASSCWL